MKNYPKPLAFLAILVLAVVRLPAEGHSAAEMATWHKAADNKIVAQKLVNDLMAAHPELLIVGIHGVAPGAKSGTMIATNLDRVGKVSDEDDNAVADDHRIILEINKTDPNRFEVLIWMKDATGRELDAAVGFVLKYNKKTDSDIAMLTKGVALRDELAAKIPSWEALFAPAKL
jgi:hypothetical protein